MTDTDDIKFIRRCLELAIKAEGSTFPNPMVGSVITHNGLIIGEGFHLKPGGNHAEVNAINSVKDKELLKSSTLYVNLEPCSHYGKTPPCADFIVSHAIPRVVVGTIDTSSKVSGKGIEILKNAGCEVVTGVADDECRWLNRRFFTFHEKKRPYIIFKWAQSADCYIDVIRHENHAIRPTWITGKPEKVLVHKWRASEQSILAGAGTIRADNPMLNVREWAGKNPLRLILSSSGQIGEELAVSEPAGDVVIFTHNTKVNFRKIKPVILDNNQSSAVQICEFLYNSGIQSLFIEGGAEVFNHFIHNSLWDEARIFTGNDYFFNGVKAPVLKGSLISQSVYSRSRLDVYANTEMVHYGTL